MELSSTALIKDDAIVAGDVLCSVTSKGNLAMLQITSVKPSGRTYDPPGYAGKLTLWKQPMRRQAVGRRPAGRARPARNGVNGRWRLSTRTQAPHQSPGTGSGHALVRP